MTAGLTTPLGDRHFRLAMIPGKGPTCPAATNGMNVRERRPREYVVNVLSPGLRGIVLENHVASRLADLDSRDRVRVCLRTGAGSKAPADRVTLSDLGSQRGMTMSLKVSGADWDRVSIWIASGA